MSLLKYRRWQQQYREWANSSFGEENHSLCVKKDSPRVSAPTGALCRRWISTLWSGNPSSNHCIQLLAPNLNLWPVWSLETVSETNPKSRFGRTEGFSKKQSEQGGAAGHHGGAFPGPPWTSPSATSTAPPLLLCLQTTQDLSSHHVSYMLGWDFFKSSSFPKTFLTLSHDSSFSSFISVLSPLDQSSYHAPSFSCTYITFIALFLSVTFSFYSFTPFFPPPISNFLIGQNHRRV